MHKRNAMALTAALAGMVAVTYVAWTVGPRLGAGPSVAIVVSAPTYGERIERALDRAPEAFLSADARDRLGEQLPDGLAIGTDRPATLANLPTGREVVDVLSDPELRPLLEGLDELAVTQKLVERGIGALVVHRRVAQSADQGGRILSKLYHHGQLDTLSLTRATDDLLIYGVRPRPLEFSSRMAALSVTYLRARLQGKTVTGFPAIQSETGSWELMAILRGQGSELATALSRNKSLQGALDELARDLERAYRRNAEPTGFPPLPTAGEDVGLEIIRITERALIEPRDEAFLEDYWELGIDGAYMLSADKKQRSVLPGSVSYTRSIITADAFLRAAAVQGKMSEKRPWRDHSAWLESLRGIHYRVDDKRGLVFLYRGVPAIPLDAVNVETARRSIVAAGDWYLNNLVPHGQVVYKFWPAENRYSNEYNLVRHTLATWNLVQAYEMDPSREDFLDGAQRALSYTQRFMKREQLPDGSFMAYYTYNHNQKLGTVVVNLLGMASLARATSDHSTDETMKELGRFVLFMQSEDGRFNPYYVASGHPSEGQVNDIVPGEAALALVTLAEYFDDDSWVATIPKYFEYYMPWFRERAARADHDAPWPANTYSNATRLELVQFGPWSVMAANAYHRRTGSEVAVDFGLEVARWMIDSYEWTAERSPYPDYVGGYYKMPGELPAMQAFCYAEGTAAAYQLALRARPDQAGWFGEHTRESVRFGLQMQFHDEDTYAFSRPAQVWGGIRYSMNETKVRIDYVHHALSAMVQWVRGAEQDPNLSDAIKNGPPMFLYVAVPEPGTEPPPESSPPPMLQAPRPGWAFPVPWTLQPDAADMAPGPAAAPGKGTLDDDDGQE